MKTRRGRVSLVAGGPGLLALSARPSGRRPSGRRSGSQSSPVEPEVLIPVRQNKTRRGRVSLVAGGLGLLALSARPSGRRPSGRRSGSQSSPVEPEVLIPVRHNKTRRGRVSLVAGGLGFEPRLEESESSVLPLDDPPI